MSDGSKMRKVLQHGLTVLLVALIGVNVWWFFFKGQPRSEHPLAEAPAPAMALPVLDAQGNSGAALDLSVLKGKVVLVDFWATHCGPCKKQMPILEQLQRSLPPERFTVLSVNIDDVDMKDRGARVASFVQKGGYTFPVVMDNGQVWKSWYVKRIPTLFIIDAQGQVSYVHTGIISESRLRERIDRLMEDAG